MANQSDHIKTVLEKIRDEAQEALNELATAGRDPSVSLELRELRSR